ncbi:MAG: argininosuccinate lyase [Nitrospira sp.]|nr:argininosuccinate lyase [Nitrospira sp.]
MNLGKGKGQPRGVVPTSSNRRPPGKKGAPAKAWTGRFTEPTHALVERFTSSLPFDRHLFEYDILGSLAHCQALEKAKILTRTERRALVRGLELVRDELRENRFPFSDSDEDIHMAVERRLTELVGPVGGKLHTGRSRNDQVTLDLRLYLRDHLRTLESRIQDLQRAFVGRARENLDVIIPGYTHLQRAQPVSLAHHLLAYVEMLERDNARARDACKRVNMMPLGSGALAGNNYPIDRAFIAKLLGFPALTRNSLDAVSDRDYVAETLGVLAIIMMHLSRLSEELVLWSSQEFFFVELPDGFCTGSSMLPQKKNPDVPELIRGKTGRVYGHFLSIMTTLKGLPLSYNRDLQEDKEPLFDAMETVLECLTIYAELIRHLRVRRDVLSGAVEAGFLLATELADYLVNKGVPFREAHGIVGRLVRHCLDHRMEWQDLSLADLKAASPYFAKDALGFLTLEGAVDRKAQTGGTARKQVTRQVNAWEARLAKKA